VSYFVNKFRGYFHDYFKKSTDFLSGKGIAKKSGDIKC
jgi:hypothetical protein